MKITKDTLKKWQKEADDEFKKECYKKIYKAVLHNTQTLKRLDTKEGQDELGADNVPIKRAELERVLERDKVDLLWLEEQFK